MKELIDLFDNMSLKKKLIILFLLVSMIPTLIIGFASYNISSKVVKERKIDETIYKLKNVEEKVWDLLKEKELVAIRFSMNENVHNILLNEHNIEKTEEVKNVFDLQKMLFDYKFAENTHSLYIFSSSGKVYTNDTIPRMNFVDISNMPLYKEQLEKKQNYFWGEINFLGEYKVLPLVRIIKDRTNNKAIGTVVVNLEEKGIYNTYKDNIKNIADTVVVLNNNNNIISSNDKRLLGKSFEEAFGLKHNFSNKTGYFNVKINKKNYILIYTVDEKTGWSYMGIVSLDKIIASANYIKKIAIFLVLICIQICLSFSLFVSSRVSKPIQKLSQIMDHAESGNLDVDFYPKFNDEIGRLAKSYNNMVKRLQNSIDEIYEIQNKKREAEYRALEFQINPHFLYNTLSSIIWLTNKGERDSVINVASALSNLFRISISRGRDLITIKEEIEHVKSYLEIQKIRYQDQFKCIIDVDMDILNYYTLKILLQPLVENAIYHGIRDNDVNGLIRIIGKKVDDKIILEVIDNGDGLTQQQIEYINDFLEKGRNENNFGIGLRNVNDRIRFYYKDGYGLKFEKHGVNTVARITLPVIREAKGDVQHFDC